MPDRISNLVMTRHLYETLLAMRALAADGQEAIENDAQCGEDRLRNAEAKATMEMADFYVEEFRERYNGGHLPEGTDGIYILDRNDYRTRPMQFAERLYEDGLNEMQRQGIEPNIHSVPARIEGMLFAIQSGIEACEGFPMDSDRMKWLVHKLNEVRIEAGIEPVPNTGEASMHKCGYPADSTMCKESHG